MSIQLTDNRECIIYPGLFMKDAESENGFTSKINYYNKAATRLQDLTNLYKLQIQIPVIRREDMLLKVEDNVLFITTRTYTEKFKKSKPGEISERETSYLILPDDADTEFISAEYKSGILTLHIPKNNGLPITQKKITDIVVY